MISYPEEEIFQVVCLKSFIEKTKQDTKAIRVKSKSFSFNVSPKCVANDFPKATIASGLPDPTFMQI